MENTATAMPAPERRVPAERGMVLAAIAVFAALSVICAALSDGFVAADACTHFLYAKYAFSDPVNLVDVWARPFVTALFAAPAHFGGRMGVRVTSLLVAIGCAVVAWRIAAGQGLKRPGLALLFTLGQPLFFVYSFGEMTELPFALLLGAAFWAYQDRRWFWAALLAGLTPAARPEGFAFVLLAAVGLIRNRRWGELLLVPLPLLGWDLAGWMLTGRAGPWWRWLADAWPWSAKGLYGRGNILTYVAVLPVIVSPLVLPAMFVGIWRSLRGTGWMRSRSMPNEQCDAGAATHLKTCRFLTAAIPMFVLVSHSLLRWLGKLGSFGEPRYLLVVAPFWGVLSAAGWEWIFSRMKWKRPMRWAAMAVLVPVVVNVVHPAVPIHLDREWQIARRFADWYRQSELRTRYPNVIASHPGIFYFLDRDPTGVARTGGFTRGNIRAIPPGTIAVWDPTFGDRNANTDNAVTPEALNQAGWIEQPAIEKVLNGRPGNDVSQVVTVRWRVFVSR